MCEFEDMNVWIRIDVNSYSLLDGTDDFVNELKKDYPVQFRKIWYPAACEGTEIVIQFFTDSSLGSFLTNVVFAGIAYDITKSLFKKAWNALLKFMEHNDAIDIQPLDFVFNDITIRIDDVTRDNYLNLALLFQQLRRHIIKLESNGIKNISLIRLPVVGEESADFNVSEEVRSGQKYSDCIWYVEYDLGCNVCYYNSNMEEIMDV